MLKVLAAIDGSEAANRAVEHVISLEKNGMPVEVLLLNVQPEIVTWQTHGLAQEPMVAHRQGLGKQAAGVSESLLRAAGIRHQLRIEIGDPAETVAQIAAEQGSDLIVMGTRGAGAIETRVRPYPRWFWRSSVSAVPPPSTLRVGPRCAGHPTALAVR